MAGVIRHLAAGMVAIGLTMAGVPATAQQSPAQVKAQRERAAREAAARAQAQRDRAAASAAAAANARARAAATARQQAMRAEAERQARAKKKATLIAARQQALRDGKLNVGFMVGRWADNDPSYCRVEDGYSGIYFDDNGEWGAYEDGGKWSIRDGDLIFSRAKYDGDGDGYDGAKLLGYIDEVNKVVTLTDSLLVVEVNGGNDAWFRCESTPASVVKPKSRFSETEYEYYDDAWRRADDINLSWSKGEFENTFQMITTYLHDFPKLTHKTSNLLNYAGLYQWKSVGDRRQAAAWFLRNYQNDPSGERAADSLLSLAQIMQEMGDTANYCISMKNFTANYPFEAQYRLKKRFIEVSKIAPCI